MTTVLFVHGTGVREPRYTKLYELIKDSLQKKRADLKFARCYWGEECGAKLNAEGASIPTYNNARAIGSSSQQTDEDYSRILWEYLYADPLYELRTLSLRPEASGGFVPGQLDTGQQLAKQVREFKSNQVLNLLLQEAGIASVLEEARKAVTGSTPYLDTIKTVGPNSNLQEYYEVIARAVVAQAIKLSQQKDLFPRVATDARLRDELVTQIDNILNGGTSGRGVVGDWMKKQLVGMAETVISGYAQRRRGAISDSVNPAAGDILLYQGRGEQIRAFIKGEIQKASDPVVLIGHSLGGIACVDLLVLENLPQVKLLVTVGSQSPFFYEIGALHSLKYGQELPKPQFPRWLNIYDLQDFLSYVGATVFKGQVEDVVVDNRQPFPVSHSAYFTNPDTYAAIAGRLPQ
jgi:hypothetical protein